jgi:hypothetical protein
MIYQNLEIVPEGTADRTAAVLIGSQGSVHQYETQKGLIQIRSLEDIDSKLRNKGKDGTLPDQKGNVLADCAEIALVAGGGEPFYCISTMIGGKEDWDSALKVLKNNDRTMFVCPVTNVANDLIEVSNTCLTLSKEDTQKWKRCYIGLESNAFDEDGKVQTYQEISATDSSNIKALYTKDSDGEYYILYTDAAYKTLLTSAQLFKDKDKESEKTVTYYYKTGTNDTVEKTLTLTSSTKVYYNLVTRFAEDAGQRTCLIWSAGAKSAYATETGVHDDDILSAQQVAAGITALRASILPQQGLSRRTLSWIYSIPEAYTKFDTQSLNRIAVEGVFIVTQDDEDSDVYIRHQLTNDLTRGILYYEDSVGVNADTICYGLKDLVKPYIGQRNNTQETLVEIKNRVADYLLGLTSTGVSLDARRIGPQIKEVDLNSLIVRLDDNFKDRVIISVDVVLPVPLNQVHVHLNAFVSLNNTVESA